MTTREVFPDPSREQAAAGEPATGEGFSVLRVRIGILLVVLWWLPFYLLGPAIADLLGRGDDAQARRAITISIVCIQTVLGLVGVYLAGNGLVATLGKVRRRRVLQAVWRIVWSGDARIADDDVKEPKTEAAAATSRPVAGGKDTP